jgi:hypothetical protein
MSRSAIHCRWWSALTSRYVKQIINCRLFFGSFSLLNPTEPIYFVVFTSPPPTTTAVLGSYLSSLYS